MADTQAPSASSRTLRVTNLTHNSFTILWERATDNVTSVNQIRYQVGLTEANNPQDPWHTVKDAQGICSHTFTGLKANTQYAVYVKAYDAAGNKFQYPVDNGSMRVTTAAQTTQIKDTVAPKASSQDLRATAITDNSITLAWTAATDDQTASSQINYYVYCGKVTGNSIAWKLVHTAKGISSYKITNLEPKTQYALLVYAKDAAGNRLSYPKAGSKVVTTTGTAATAQTSDAARLQSFRNFFSSVRSKDTLANLKVSELPVPEQKFILSGTNQAMQLVNETHDINNPCDEFMPVNESTVYPGRLIFANDKLINGKAEDVNFYVKNQVGKVNVSVNFLSSGVEPTAEKNVPATYNDVKDAIGRILNRTLKSGSLPPALVESNVFTSNSKEKIAVDLGCSVDYLGAKCKIDTSTTKSQESFYQLEEFTQGFYQVYVDPDNKDNANYLGPDVTLAALQNAYKEAPIAVIKSVTYGRIGLNMKKYDASSFVFKGSESASYKTYAEVTSKQDIEKNSSTTTHFARVWGGSATTAGTAITNGISKTGSTDDKKIDAEFTKALTSKMEVSMQNQGVPIAYTAVFLASGREVGAFLTGKYRESKYIPLVNRLTLRIVQGASVLHGTNTISVGLEYTYFQLDSKGNKVGNTLSGAWEHKWSNGAEVNTVIQLPPNCFFTNNEVFVRIRSRRAASAGLNKWKHCSTGYVNITGGKLWLKLTGSYYSYNVRLGGNTSEGYAQFK